MHERQCRELRTRQNDTRTSPEYDDAAASLHAALMPSSTASRNARIFPLRDEVRSFDQIAMARNASYFGVPISPQFRRPDVRGSHFAQFLPTMDVRARDAPSSNLRRSVDSVSTKAGRINESRSARVLSGPRRVGRGLAASQHSGSADSSSRSECEMRNRGGIPGPLPSRGGKPPPPICRIYAAAFSALLYTFPPPNRVH